MRVCATSRRSRGRKRARGERTRSKQILSTSARRARVHLHARRSARALSHTHTTQACTRAYTYTHKHTQEHKHADTTQKASEQAHRQLLASFFGHDRVWQKSTNNFSRCRRRDCRLLLPAHAEGAALLSQQTAQRARQGSTETHTCTHTQTQPESARAIADMSEHTILVSPAFRRQVLGLEMQGRAWGSLSS